MINTDGLVDAHGNAACGGLIRDHNGVFILGFQKKIGTCSVLPAGLWGLRDGLKFAKDCNYSNIIVCTDAIAVTNVLQD